ncbi:MAG: M24 family metallopeptidase [Rhizobiaceae bacterium]|nr:M24 family metallopeptidase [Rhizobiaceae bacterium]
MDFETAEFEQRTIRAQELMHAAGFDALFLMSEPEVRYFTGFRTLFWQSPTRPWFVVVPAKGKPIAIIPAIGEPLMRTTWLDDVRCWSSPDANDDGIALLTSALAEFSTVGVMMGRESQLRMPLSDFQNLQSDLTGTRFVDASPMVAGLRLIKSDAEISILSEICTIASNAFDQAGQLFHVGQPLNQAFKAFKIELLKQGAEDVPYLVGGAGRLGYADVISPPDSRSLNESDVLMLDTGATLKGYFCDFDRNFCLGEPEDAVKQAHETLWLATEAGLNAARPGATCSDIFHAMRKIIGSEGGNVGRYGHGLGIQLTETPSLIDWDVTVLREGAVITLEPSMNVSGGDMLVHEENIVIRDGAPQLLTRRTPRQMPSI